MDGSNNRQNTIPTIPDITIPKISFINNPFHQHTKSLSEGSIDRKGDKLEGQYERVDRRGRQEGKTRQQDGGGAYKYGGHAILDRTQYQQYQL